MQIIWILPIKNDKSVITFIIKSMGPLDKYSLQIWVMEDVNTEIFMLKYNQEA